jgi:hypothetical protein
MLWVDRDFFKMSSLSKLYSPTAGCLLSSLFHSAKNYDFWDVDLKADSPAGFIGSSWYEEGFFSI